MKEHLARLMAVCLTLSVCLPALCVTPVLAGSPPAAAVAFSSSDEQPIFPLARGTYWIYQGNVKWMVDSDVFEKDITWRVEVQEVVERQHVTGYRLKGFPTDLAFYEDGDEPLDHVFIQVGGNKFFESNLEDFQRLKNPDDDLLNLVGQGQLMLELPLVVGNVFGETEQITRPDGLYAWRVESEQPADLTGIEGVAADIEAASYLLSYSSLPDRETETWVPGIGMVHFTYEHHGTIAEADVRLIEFHAGENQAGSGDVIAVDAKDDGSQIDLSVGQILQVTLEGNPTTGYEWMHHPDDSGVLEQQGDYLYTASSEAIGSGGQFIFNFLAVAAGQGKLELGYQRPWESVQPLETFNLEVTVAETGTEETGAAQPSAPTTSDREAVSTDKAPAAVGPYSQAIRTGVLVFTAGQVALDPATGKLVAGGIEEQTRQALDNLAAILEEAGTSLDRVAKTTVYLTDIDDFHAMNEVYAQYFSPPEPARSTVQVSALPKGARVEIEVVAVLP